MNTTQDNKSTEMEIKSGLTIFAKKEPGLSGSEQRKLGTVDRLDGEHLKLKSQDSADGKTHYIPRNWVEKVDEKSAYLNKTSEEFKRGQLDEIPLLSEVTAKAV